jgi:hypothetical protein
MHRLIHCYLGLLLLALSAKAYAQSGSQAILRSRIKKVMDTPHARIGVGILGLDFHDSLRQWQPALPDAERL